MLIDELKIAWLYTVEVHKRNADQTAFLKLISHCYVSVAQGINKVFLSN